MASMQHVPMVDGIPSLLPFRNKPPEPQPPTQYADLQDGYNMYTYGERQTQFASRLAVPEPNYGVVINAEFPMRKEDFGREVGIADYEIRNQNWTHVGPLLRAAEKPQHLRPDAQSAARAQRGQQASSQAASISRSLDSMENQAGSHAAYLQAVADWTGATDCHLGHSQEALREKYDRLHGKFKNPGRYQEYDEIFDRGCFGKGPDGRMHLERPITDKDLMRDFWNNPAAVTTGGGYQYYDD